MREYYKIKLEKHGGCEGCSNKCRSNGPVAIPETASLTNGKKFECNSKLKDRR